MAAEIAALRGRIAAYFDSLASAAEANILATYSFRLAAAASCFPRDQLAAAREGLCRQRDAELAALRLALNAEKQSSEQREIAALRASRRAHYLAHRVGVSVTPIVQRYFRAAKGEVATPASPKAKRAPVRRPQTQFRSRPAMGPA